MHEADLLGVADGGPAGLGVFDDVQRHVQVGSGVYVDVADAGAGLDAGHLRVLRHGADQPRAAPGDQQVHQAHGGHQVRGALAGGVADELDEIGVQANLFQSLAQRLDDGQRRVEGLLAAAQHAGASGLEGQRRGVAGDVGAAFVDDGDDAHGHARALDDEAVGALHAADHRAHGVGQRRHLADALRHALNAPGVEHQAVQHHITDAALRRLHVDGVRGENGVLAGDQRVRHGVQRRVLLDRVRASERGRRRAGGFEDFSRRHD